MRFCGMFLVSFYTSEVCKHVKRISFAFKISISCTVEFIDFRVSA
jgi:hypothetical protein